MTPDPEVPTPPRILDAQGQPARTPASRACPRCAGLSRVPSSGFGTPHDVCRTCGYEWPDEHTSNWNEATR